MFSECNGHPGQRYETQCNNCNNPVCVKCILSGAHKSENVEELMETFERRSQETKTKDRNKRENNTQERNTDTKH